MEYVAVVALATFVWILTPLRQRCVCVLSAGVATALVRTEALTSVLREGGSVDKPARMMRSGCTSAVSLASSWPLEASATSRNLSRLCAAVEEDDDFAAVVFVGLFAFCVAFLLLHFRPVRLAFISYLTAVTLVSAVYARGDGVLLLSRMTRLTAFHFDVTHVLSEGAVASIDGTCIQVLRLACAWVAYLLLTVMTAV